MKVKNVLLILLVIVLISISFAFYSILTSTNGSDYIDNFQSKAATAVVPTISLEPMSGSYSLGSTFSVNIVIDTLGKAIDGVDMLYLNYNPAYLQVQDADSAIAGVQIQPGTIFPMYLGNNVDTIKGKISLSGIVSAGGEGYVGNGTFATVTFKTLKVTSRTPTSVYFNFTSGSTIDTNFNAHGLGQDILQAVNNGSYAIKRSSKEKTR